ncbi:MAG: cyclic nucleotide-binding domain-containing protein [Actinomycetia bacterium]|nr:cyclic nucleotide-binding domain-containing protein [Actinomycetes bacterium]
MELEQSAALFERIRRMAGERVTREADYGYSLFLVLAGRLQVEVDGETVAELGPGDHFGEVSLVTGQKRNATVRALETCELGKIMVWEFKELMDLHPSLATRIEAVAADRS